MKHLKLFENFDEGDFVGIVKDILSDLTDEGFDIKVEIDKIQDQKAEITNFGYYPMVDIIRVIICKRGMEYNRQSFIGFDLIDIKGSVSELFSQLHDKSIYDVYYHIKGYEPNTWYSVNDNSLEDINTILSNIDDELSPKSGSNLPANPQLDRLNIEFVI